MAEATSAAARPKATGVRQLGHVPALDGIRGFALIGVIAIHAQILTLSHTFTGQADIDQFIRGGYLGLDMFFVLSGFLISALLLGEVGRTGDIRFGAFYLRRALRLLPALYALLIGYAIYASLTDLETGQLGPTIQSALLYYTNWQIVTDPTTMSEELVHLWSLAFEEQFYLIWPVILIGLVSLRLSTRTMAVVIGAGIAGVSIWRAHLWAVGVDWPELSIRTDARIDAMLWGALVAVLWTRRKTPVRGVDEAAWAALAVMAWCAYSFDGTESISYQGGLTIFHGATAVVLLAVLNGTWGFIGFFDFAFFRMMGRYSYGIYLWHHFIFFALTRQTPTWSGTQRVIVATILTAAAAAASWILIERPAMRLKTRFGGRKLPFVGEPRPAPARKVEVS
jgi:peptidoglycan/LPS O-acetylase OafA/YrhL